MLRLCNGLHLPLSHHIALALEAIGGEEQHTLTQSQSHTVHFIIVELGQRQQKKK